MFFRLIAPLGALLLVAAAPDTPLPSPARVQALLFDAATHGRTDMINRYPLYRLARMLPHLFTVKQKNPPFCGCPPQIVVTGESK